MLGPGETGFGGPDDDAEDLGFGSPDDGASLQGDTGFGSPSALTGARPSQREVSDDGGEIITLLGDFSGHPGPYRVYVVTGSGNLPCFGTVAGRGYDCFPSAAATTMDFATPPAAPGTYSLLVVGAVEETIANALTFVPRVYKDAVYTMRQRWPDDSMPVGPQLVEEEPFAFSYELTPDIRRELVKALGEELALIDGYRLTRTTADFGPTDTTLQIESTYTLPDVGVVYVADLDEPRLAYTGRTATTLTGITRSPRERRTAGQGAVVAEAENDWSVLDRSVSELLFARASGTALDRLAEGVLGLGRPGTWMDDTAFRGLAITLLWLARGPWLAVWQVCEAWLLPFTHQATVTIAGAAITDATAGFADHHVGRYVRVYDGAASFVHRIVGRSGNTVTLDDVGGPYWTPAAYTSASRTYRLIPFWIERDADAGGELPGQIRVHAAATGLHAPATYLQDNTEADLAAVTPPGLTAGAVDVEQEPGAAGDPYSGFIMESVEDDGTALLPDHPVYIYDPDIPALRILLEDVVAAWCRVEVITTPA